MRREYKVIEIHKEPSEKSKGGVDVIALHIQENKTVKLSNIMIPKHTQVGDLIRWAEHRFYDVIDENGNIVSR